MVSSQRSAYDPSDVSYLGADCRMIRSALAYFGSASRPEQPPPPPAWRRVFHIIAGSSIPIAGIFAAEMGMVLALAVVSGGGLSLELTRFRIPWVNRHFLRWLTPLFKYNEDHRFTGATFFNCRRLIFVPLFRLTKWRYPPFSFFHWETPLRRWWAGRSRAQEYIG